MKKKSEKNYFVKFLAFLLIASTILSLMVMGGCSDTSVKLDPDNPVTITIWHYYNGAILNVFEESIKNFNETVGLEKGIIVEGQGHGNVSELEEAVLSSANEEIGSMSMPNIFASYADTAYAAEQMGLLANLDDYFTGEEQETYLESYIEEGRIGLNGELRIFPIAKSTEIMMINETDWLKFAGANNLAYDDLKTLEDIVRVSEVYYNWSGGKSFFGRDVMANLFIAASKMFETEIFEVKNGIGTININKEVMKKIWDNYYVPYISGYFSAYGRFRSDDMKVGDILAYVGSSASVSFCPNEVTIDGNVYPIDVKVLPVPLFENSKKTMIQQGAGMVVTKSTPEEEYASSVFLKWFTETDKNIEFAALSGYMPVKKEAVDYETLKLQIDKSNITLDNIMGETLKISLSEIKTSELYTNKAFKGGKTARSILEGDLQEKAVADREAVLQIIASGNTHEQAVAQFNTEDNFNAWLNKMTLKLNEAAKEET